MSDKKRATLILDDGTQFRGFLFGAETAAGGEVVFNTAMTGYPEIMTDPASAGRIVVMTYPLIGNYGVPGDEREDGLAKNFESDRIQARGLVVTDYSPEPSHWNARESLDTWLRREGVAGIWGVDTRAAAKHLREHGTMGGRIVVEGVPEPAAKAVELADVSCKKPETYGNGKHKVMLVDCGVANSVIRKLPERGATVVRVPWDHDFTGEEYDALVVAGGPAIDPHGAEKTIAHIRKALASDKPVLGIGLGHLLLALAAGAEVVKLKHGHHGANQPVRLCGTDSMTITGQNHGWAVDAESLPKDWEPSHENLNDGTNEGIRHRTKPWFSVQFAPDNTVFDNLYSLLFCGKK